MKQGINLPLASLIKFGDHENNLTERTEMAEISRL